MSVIMLLVCVIVQIIWTHNSRQKQQNANRLPVAKDNVDPNELEAIRNMLARSRDNCEKDKPQ